MHFNNIIVTTDFSDDSVHAFDTAAYEAKMQDSKVTLVAIVEDWAVPPVFMHDIANPEAITKYREELLEKARNKLKEYGEKHFAGIKVESHAVLSESAPAAVICDYAKEIGANLIIMSSHGRGALGNLLMGSVVQKVIRSAPCPVLVIPRHD